MTRDLAYDIAPIEDGRWAVISLATGALIDTGLDLDEACVRARELCWLQVEADGATKQ